MDFTEMRLMDYAPKQIIKSTSKSKQVLCTLFMAYHIEAQKMVGILQMTFSN